MTKKLHLCRMVDGRVIGNIKSINCDGFSILDAFENKKPGEYLIFDDRLEQVGSFSDHGMSFEKREIGEMIKETLEEMKPSEQNTVPLIKGEGLLVLISGYLEVNGEGEDKQFVIEKDGNVYPVNLFHDPDEKQIGDYVSFIGTMRVVDGKTQAFGSIKDFDSQLSVASVIGTGKIDVENKRFIADFEDDHENSISIDLDNDILFVFNEEMKTHGSAIIAGPLHYDGNEYSFTPRSIIEANMSTNKQRTPEMGMMS